MLAGLAATPPPAPNPVLATQVYAPGTLANYSLTTSMVALDTTNLTLAFTVPPNGIVDVEVSCEVEMSSASGTGEVLGLALLNHTGGAQLGYTINAFGDSSIASNLLATVAVKFHLTGLTPGALQVDLAASISSNTGAGNVFAMGYTGAASGSKTSPLMMQALISR